MRIDEYVMFWNVFDISEFIDAEWKCYVMILKCFVSEIQVENLEKQLLEACASYHASQDLDACETHGTPGMFFQSLESHAS